MPRAKNIVYREGNKVYIKRLFSKYCPVALLERYILMAEVDLNSNLPLFRPLRSNLPLRTSCMEISSHI